MTMFICVIKLGPCLIGYLLCNAHHRTMQSMDEQTSTYIGATFVQVLEWNEITGGPNDRFFRNKEN